jgi:tetratricopeptide (TPR) repeat protein
MSVKFDQKKFDQWQELRKTLKEAKRSKAYERVVELCNKIIGLDKSARFIQIMTPLFFKEMGVAYSKLGENENALEAYKSARDGFMEYRKHNNLHSPDDWLKDIQSLDKKIGKLE